MKDAAEILIVIIGGIGFIALALLIFPFFLWLAWNNTLPVLFHFPTITFIQALWIDVLLIIIRGVQWNNSVSKK